MKKFLICLNVAAVLVQSACQKLPTLGENYNSSGYNSETLTWLFADGNGADGLNKDTARDANIPRMISFNGKLYIAWAESNGTASQLRVKVMTGTLSSPAWQFVDGGGVNGINRDAAYAAVVPYFAVNSGVLYLAWQEQTAANKTQIRVAQYNGNDAAPVWSSIDGGSLNRLTTEDAESPQLVVFNNALHVLYNEKSGTTPQIRGRVYAGGQTWNFIDGGGALGVNVDTSKAAQNPYGAVFNSKLYVTWHEISASDKTIVRARSYDGTTWSTVDNGGLSKDATKNSLFPLSIVHAGKLYIGWHEFSTSSFQMRVAATSGTTWSFVDGAGLNGINRDASKNAVRFTPIVFNNKLYVIFGEENQSLIPNVRATAFDGTQTFTFAEGTGADGLNREKNREALRPYAAVHNSELFVAWAEDNAAIKKNIRVISGK